MVNFGILASMSWNSNRWSDRASREDISRSNYDYVKTNGWMHEDINFGQENYPLESDGKYIAYTPMFNTLPSRDESRYVDIVFLRSLDYHTNTNFIVGFYAFPEIGHFSRKAAHPYFAQYDFGNLKAKPDHIILFDTPIPVSNDIATREQYLPKGKKLGQQGYNYLSYDNVLKIMDKATTLNPGNNRLKSIKLKFLTEKKYYTTTRIR